MNPDEIRRLIEEGLAGSHVVVSGDGRHFEATVVHESFAGKTMLAQHRLVYAVLSDSFASEALHALALKTYTPEQWASVNA